MRKDLQNVEALTFDPISRLLYWVDAGAQKIEVSEKNIQLKYHFSSISDPLQFSVKMKVWLWLECLHQIGRS